MEKFPYMTLHDFWSVIDQARSKGSTEEIMAAGIQQILADMPSERIAQWGAVYHFYRDLANKDKLWAAADIMDGGFCSSDGFLDFRAWLISQGHEIYKAALQNADSLAQLPFQENVQFEAIHYAPVTAYEEKTGLDYYKALRDELVPESLIQEILYDIKFSKDTEQIYSPESSKEIFPNLWRIYNPSIPAKSAQEIKAKAGNGLDYAMNILKCANALREGLFDKNPPEKKVPAGDIIAFEKQLHKLTSQYGYDAMCCVIANVVRNALPGQYTPVERYWATQQPKFSEIESIAKIIAYPNVVSEAITILGKYEKIRAENPYSFLPWMEWHMEKEQLIRCAREFRNDAFPDDMPLNKVIFTIEKKYTEQCVNTVIAQSIRIASQYNSGLDQTIISWAKDQPAFPNQNGVGDYPITIPASIHLLNLLGKNLVDRENNKYIKKCRNHER